MKLKSEIVFQTSLICEMLHLYDFTLFKVKLTLSANIITIIILIQDKRVTQ